MQNSEIIASHNIETNENKDGMQILTIENYNDGIKGLEFTYIYRSDNFYYKFCGTEIRPTQFYITENNNSFLFNPSQTTNEKE